MEQKKLSLDDILSRYRLDPNDGELADTLITEMQRGQLSPKLNILFSELDILRKELRPVPDFEFIQRFVSRSNEIFIERGNSFSLISTSSSYQRTWDTQSSFSPIPVINPFAFKYNFTILNRNEGCSIFFITMHGPFEDNLMRIKIWDLEYEEGSDRNWKHEDERDLTIDKLFEVLPVLIQNLIISYREENLDRNLYGIEEEHAVDFWRGSEDNGDDYEE